MNSDAMQLDQLLRKHSLTVAIETYYPSSEAAEYFLERLNGLQQEISRRDLAQFDVSIAGIKAWLETAPYEAEAFLQALVFLRSSQILLAALLVIRGYHIDALELHHKRNDRFKLMLRLFDGTNNFEFTSDDIFDAVIFRHLGKATVGDKPTFDGFYALKAIV